MTSSTTKIPAVSNGTVTELSDPADKSIGDLRRAEAKGLINLICDAIRTTGDLAYGMHRRIYKELDTTPVDQLKERLYAALTCMGTADHYLRMLDEVLVDISGLPGEPPF